MFSIITPHYSGSNAYIDETYQSLLTQTMTDWQWVVVLNNGGELSAAICQDVRVKIVKYSEENSNVAIGLLKRIACENANGDIIVELDSDDMLTENALEEIQKAFDTHPDIPFVFSNDAEFEHETWKPNCYGSYWGWENRPFEWHEHKLIEQVAMPATSQALRAIFWSPNHVRAWRKADYFRIGEHNPEHSVVDDYDLICRFYLHAEMYHIDKCLYLYRRHGKNTTFTRNAEIQIGNDVTYAKYVIPMAEAWSKRNGLPMLDLGGGFNKPAGYIGLDQVGADIACNLEQGIPYPDNSVGIVRAYDFLEHMHSPIKVMNEIYRVLAPGGWLHVSVPSSDGRGAYQDPTHVSFWNQNSFWYYTNPEYARFVRDIKCKFQVSRVITWYPSDWHRQNDISYVDAQLIALKDGYKSIGENLWQS